MDVCARNVEWIDRVMRASESHLNAVSQSATEVQPLLGFRLHRARSVTHPCLQHDANCDCFQPTDQPPLAPSDPAQLHVCDS